MAETVNFICKYLEGLAPEKGFFKLAHSDGATAVVTVCKLALNKWGWKLVFLFEWLGTFSGNSLAALLLRWNSVRVFVVSIA